MWLGVRGFVSGYGSVYDWLLSMCYVSFIIRLREMYGGFIPTSFVSASRRIWRIVVWSSVENAFSFATRYIFSFGLHLCNGPVEVGWKGMNAIFRV